jgi:predicted house-cleaning noncanonical NTP pyrophosphatase (MazG superfamily)
MSLKRFRVEKLIRDLLPNIMRDKGILVYERTMEQDEFISKLKDKLQEEAGEVKHTANKNELTEELADMLEVLYALSKATGISWEQIEKTRLVKQKAKGGFDKKIYNPYVDIEESNPSIEYYLKKADHYPLVETTTQ